MNISKELQGKEVSLEEILISRENRAIKQKELLKEKNTECIVCLNINMPGPIKLNDVSKNIFKKGIDELLKMPFLMNKKFIYDNLITGPEAYFALKNAPEEVKNFTCKLEEKYKWARLLDIDVIDKSGIPLSRKMFGFSERGCIVCGRPGSTCASRRIHKLDELLEAILRVSKEE